MGNWRFRYSDTRITGYEEAQGIKTVEGIGWGMSDGDVEIAKSIMADSPESWVFVIPDNVRLIEEKIKSKGFKDWLEKKGYNSGYYIFVVGSQPVSGDDDSPSWIVHDLVGHSVGERFKKTQRGLGVDNFAWIDRLDVVAAVAAIHDILPKNFKNATDTFDSIFDIAAGVVLKKITPEQCLTILDGIETDNLKELKRNFEFLFSTANNWFKNQEWVQVGENKVCVIYPWQ